ncbi:hypothetical protein [Arthrobacter sp. SLBN-112]|uniref:hypothetical protein n=1 Tax=Arthrobacter sp. SLBN-112 TaxID=2768452 RepID=UPI0027B582A9|nr:hypothetical protein [Arthrobacter sp. SLBN-112]MDQ0800338.1 hypothetical protein [Arthrobacter sp. SLBN-112]
MRDESYAAGYRAGHLQGWLDAIAPIEQMRQPTGTPQPAPQGVQPTPVPVREPAAVSPRETAASAAAAPAGQVIPAPSAMAAQVDAEGSGIVVGPGLRVQPRRPAPAPPGVRTVRPAFTPAERQARRERRDRQNINTTLYVASLLLVAAAALFVGSGLPPMLRFAGVGAVTTMFYCLGFGLHAKIARLRPAAVAFTGTGLALVPVSGLALYNFAWHNGPATWLLTSIVGTAAYVAAAIRLESKVLTYLSLTFVVSSAWSGVAVLGGALIWYFAALISVAVVFTLLSHLRPAWLPPLFVGPLAALHPYLVPGVAAAASLSLFLPAEPGLTKAEYALVLGTCGAYFAVFAAAAAALRLAYFRAARVALTIAAAVGMWHMTGRGTDALFTLVVLLGAQSVAVAFMGARLETWITRATGVTGGHQRAAHPVPKAGMARWRRDAFIEFGLQIAATAVFALAVVVAGFFPPARISVTPVPLWLPVLISLVTGFTLAARLRGRAEIAPVPALLLAAVVSHHIGEGMFAVLLALASGFWAVRAYAADGALRRLMVLNARVAVTLLAPAVAAAVTEGAVQDRAVWFVLLIAAAAQQLLSAGIQRFGISALAPQVSLVGFTLVGLGSIASVSSLEGRGSQGLTWAAVLIQLAAVLVTGLLLTGKPTDSRNWRFGAGEFLAPVVAAMLAAFAFMRLSEGAGNLVLLLLLAYMVASAPRLPALEHRWAYWWAARAAGTVLVLTAFSQLQHSTGSIVVGGEELHPASVLFAALFVQLALPLGGQMLRRAPAGVVFDAACVILLQLAACAVLAQQASGSWQHLVAVSGAAIAAALAAYVLRTEPVTVVFAPVSFLILVGLSLGNVRVVEVLLGVFAVFAAVMVVAVPRPRSKGWYFVAARVLTAVLALVLSDDVTASPTAVSVTFALVLAAQHVIRWMMRFRLAAVPFQQAAVWITLAGQALLPLVYAVQHGALWPGTDLSGSLPGGGGMGDAGRWVLLLEVGLLVVSAAVARRLFVARGALYFGIYGLLFGVLSLSPVVAFGDVAALSFTGTAVVLLFLGLAAAAAGPEWRRRSASAAGPELRLWLAAAGTFTGAALAVSPQAAGWLPGAAVLAVAAVLLTASHVEAVPMLYPPAAAAVLGGAFMLANALPGLGSDAGPGEWERYLPWLAGPGAAALGLYAARRARSAALADDPVRRWSLAGGAFFGLVLAAAAGLYRDGTAWAGVGVLIAAAAVAVFEPSPRMRRPAAELAAILIVAAVQRAAIFEFSGARGLLPWPAASQADPFWVAQWYMLLAAALAGLRYLTGSPSVGRRYACASAGLLSLSGLGTIFGGEASHQLWVLVWLAVFLAAGLVVGDRLFVRWGAVGIAVCVLWAMRQYTFALLAIVAVGLIAFAVWRLNRAAAGADKAGDAP